MAPDSILILPVLALVSSVSLWMVMAKPRFVPIFGKRTDHKISIIIPARNEAENIATLLKSIQNQSHAPHQVILVDDGSTDDTAAIAKKFGAEVISGKSLPEGWKGKPWACQQGADHASGDWLLFLDADTCLLSDFLGRLQYVTAMENDVFSVCPYHTVKQPYEQLSAFFNLLMVAGINAFGTGSSSGGNAALFGQCMMISRKHYDLVGGHSCVKDKVLENFHLADNLKEHGVKRHCYIGRDSIQMRMFPSGFGELWSSWKKGFVSGASSAQPRALAYSSIWISGAMMSIVCLIIMLATQVSPLFISLVVSAYLVYAIQCLLVFRVIGSFSFLTALFYPISLIFYQILFFSALIDRLTGKQTSWKGRMVN